MTPITWLTNKAAYGFLRLFGVKLVTRVVRPCPPTSYAPWSPKPAR